MLGAGLRTGVGSAHIVPNLRDSRKGRLPMSQDQSPEKAPDQDVPAKDEDTEGQRMNIPRANDDDTEGQRMNIPRVKEDDTEGQRMNIPRVKEDDTEGQRMSFPRVTDEDTEGHKA
jgi:hypothetical protein